ncbi:peptide deformylase [Clostridium saccharoperbutylacetonicum]|uniref:Peptide deformylase n=1 Tax=Clostridium saccharoperbutylacetonicum N1-4(HMT) TaxID=931276 RepID=M1MAS2_9CLOT|nr:peptide deformylase [Clostridium saccharoperbutylacetonicum]AGF55054.1 peptide deformylase Def [Clostridium saccharoperbutylacetonicum N1-4(HMT)]NRT64237.1 peptide deformylase [Clostridium saccharoperbutylacetonicum]NSB27604.1 peptide deformylase [Clostridium saccharoperbutylacetonicum]NSB41093.1 peptide deformylase [Clostridium saccharoperbutylacetonicum]
MALRNIRKYGDDVLRKKCREIDKIDDRLLTLIEDMKETMYEADGVGLAAPQVGILKRLFIVDIGEGPLVFINPEILETSGTQTDEEGCLSLPGKTEEVTRPNFVKARALNEKGEEFEIEAEELLARAILHEYDHLNGTLFIDRVNSPSQK